jgi:hypothetical protein
MGSLTKTITELEKNIGNTRFSMLLNICERFFGAPRVSGSHHIFKTPWKGDPRINLQATKGESKPYQVRQVLKALKTLQQNGERK